MKTYSFYKLAMSFWKVADLIVWYDGPLIALQPNGIWHEILAKIFDEKGEGLFIIQ